MAMHQKFTYIHLDLRKKHFTLSGFVCFCQLAFFHEDHIGFGHSPCLISWIKALCFIDRAIKGGEEAESRWTAPLADGHSQLVSSRVGDGREA